MQSLNVFTTQLAARCREHVLGKKWLVAPTRRVGYQWLDQVTASGQPVVNVEVKTFRGMVLDFISEDLRQKQLQLQTRLDRVVVLSRIWERLCKTDGYLFSLRPSLSLFQKLHSALNDLRMAGVEWDDLAVHHFENENKGREIAELMRAYLRQLQEHGLIDYAGAVRLAIQKAERGQLPVSEQVVILIPEDLRLKGVEQQLLESIRKHYRKLPYDTYHRKPVSVSNAYADRDLLRFLPIPGEAPPPKQDGSVSLFHAVGETNEIREVFRRCLAQNLPLDQVEIVCTDANTYIPILFEMSQSFQSSDGPFKEGLPITFADGVPARYSRPGKALIAWLDWRQNGYLQSALVRMIQDGYLRLEKGENEAQAAAWLRSVKIGMRRERYLIKLDEEMQALQEKIQTEKTFDEDGGDEKGTAVLKQLKKKLKGLRSLRKRIKALLDITPDSTAEPVCLLENAKIFLEGYAEARDEFDYNCRLGLLGQIENMRQWMANDAVPLIDIAAWLRGLPLEETFLGASPKHGRVHVSQLIGGGYAGRPHTFIVGLDDGRFPGTGGADPILLDDERVNLSENLMTAPRRINEALDGFYRLASRLRGSVTLSFASSHLADERECFPSQVLFSAYRLLSGQRDSDQSEMLQWLGLPASFIPRHADGAMTENEWWLSQLSRADIANKPELVFSAFPHLAQGATAMRERRSDVFTEWDGFVQDAGKFLNLASRKKVSSSMLETLGRCPLAFFFQYGLNLERPEELAIDENVWLNPREYGNLMHEWFELFLREHAEQGKPVDFERDYPRLLEILREKSEEYRGYFPPPSENVLQRQTAELRQAALIFLKEEEARNHFSQPLFLEAAIGLKQDRTHTPLDREEPLELNIGQNVVIKARGKIDRIDLLRNRDAEQYMIWDYKSGGPAKYRKDPPFHQGRVIQHLLYCLMAETCLQDMSPRAELVGFGYFLPGVKGQGERFEWSPQELTRGLNIIYRMVQIVSMGAFIATDTADDCRFCDFQPICRDIDTVTACGKTKMENPFNTRIQPFAALRKKDGK